MSYATLSTQVRDAALADRVNAAVQQEAHENPTLVDSDYAVQVRTVMYGAGDRLMWPVSIATEAEYASALAAQNPNPGGDESVITDGMILSAVQANWPEDEAPA